MMYHVPSCDMEVAMLAYAAPRSGREAPHPKTLLLIGAGHALVLAALMLAQTELTAPPKDPPLVLTPIVIPPDPPPVPVESKVKPAPSRAIRMKPIVDFAPKPHETIEIVPSDRVVSSTDGNGVSPADGPAVTPKIQPPPHRIVRREAQIAISGDALRPPYPDSKRMLGEQANLTLKLTIDSGGRVTDVEPIGRADPVFLAAARKHLLRVWRFTAASEDGSAVTSTKVITLHFVLDEQ